MRNPGNAKQGKRGKGKREGRQGRKTGNQEEFRKIKETDKGRKW